MTTSPTYISFLVRLWHEPNQESPASPVEWQGEIECIQTGQRWTFDTLNELLDFLRRQAKGCAVDGALNGEAI